MRLKDIGYLYSGLTGKSGDDFHVEDSSEGKEFVPFTNIFNNTRIDVSNFCRVRMEAGEVQNRVQTGDLLFLMSSEDYESIGKPAVVSDPVPELYLNSFCRGLRVTRKDVCSEYVNYYLGAEEVRKAIRLEARGFTRVNLKIDRLSAQSIELPTFKIQRQIVDYLDGRTAAIDARVAVLEKKLAAYKRLKASVINRAVTRGLDPRAKLKDSGEDWIGNVPVGWEVRRIKDIAKPLQYGASEVGLEYDPDLPRYIRITDITQDGELRAEGAQSLSEEVAKPYLLRDGDILLARSGATVGKAFVYRAQYGRGAFAGYMIRCRVIPDSAEFRFVYYWMLSSHYQAWKQRAISQATIQNIGADKYANLTVPLPDLSEQRAIADYLDAECAKVDKMAELVTQEIELYKKLKRSLVNEVVTGKRKVA